MHRIQSNDVLLRQLTARHAAAYYDLYERPAVNNGEPVFLTGETAAGFSYRIQSACDRHYGIFPGDDPEKLIGDCALHHWDPQTRSIEIGGALLPEYQGLGIMRTAFLKLIKIAKADVGAAQLTGRTRPGNDAAIGLVTGLGFRHTGEQNGEAVLTLALD